MPRLRRSAPLLVGALLAGLALPLAAAVGGGAALAAPGDPLSVVLEGQSPDFGYLKTGTSLTHTLTVRNEGLDAITIDPTPLVALTAPFTLNSTTLVAGGRIGSGETRTITVTYTAPAAGTTSSRPITLNVLDLDAAGSTVVELGFIGRSLATNRAHFQVDRAAVDFGTLQVGASVTRRLTITVGGIDPLLFKESAVVARTGAGAALPGARVSASSFGAGMTVKPGETATVDITFTPTTAGPVTGTLTLVGQVNNGDPEPPNVTVVLPISATVTAAPTPTPTPTPTPSPTGTPVPTPRPTATTPGGGTAPGGGSTPGTGNTAGSGGSSSIGSGSGVRGLASTGAEPGVAFGYAALTLLAGAIALLAVRRLRRRTR